MKLNIDPAPLREPYLSVRPFPHIALDGGISSCGIAT
jgi:hypothetical protein